MNELRVVLAFLVLGFAVGVGVGVGVGISERTPIFRWGYEVVSIKGYGKPGRAY